MGGSGKDTPEGRKIVFLTEGVVFSGAYAFVWERMLTKLSWKENQKKNLARWWTMQ
jgi:hypothetical protein